jgi:hypothetical protein
MKIKKSKTDLTFYHLIHVLDNFKQTWQWNNAEKLQQHNCNKNSDFNLNGQFHHRQKKFPHFVMCIILKDLKYLLFQQKFSVHLETGLYSPRLLLAWPASTLVRLWMNTWNKDKHLFISSHL